MAKKQHVEVTSYPIIKSIEGARQMQSLLGAHLNALIMQQSIVDEEKRKLDEAAEPRIASLRAQILECSKSLHEFATTRRATLTEDGSRKTVSLGESGHLRWYDTPPKVKLTAKVAAVIAEIRRRRAVKRFLRISESLNKEAILADPATASRIPGIEIVKEEKFVLRPSQTRGRVEVDSDGKCTIVIEEEREQTE